MKFTAYASGSTGNLYSIEDGRTSILIECGLPYREMQRLLPKVPTSYDACVISHVHGDHCNARAVAELISRGVSVMYGGALQDGLTIGTIRIKSFEVKHDVPCWGYMFRGADGESCVFATDLQHSPSKFDFSPTIFAVEANFAADMIRGCPRESRVFDAHMDLTTCIEMLKANDLSATREIILLHLSRSFCKACDGYHSDDERFIREVQAATGIPTYAAPAYRREGR